MVMDGRQWLLMAVDGCPWFSLGADVRLNVCLMSVLMSVLTWLIWSTYQKYGRHTRNMVNIPEIWSSYQKCGQHTRIMVNIPEL